MFHPEELIEQIHDLPHGSERMSALQSAITEADNASSHRWRIYFRYEYIRESVFHDDAFKAVITFPEMLAIFDEHPELQDDYEDDIMVVFKWVIENMAEFHQVSREEIERYYAEFRRRCEHLGYSLRIYYHKLCHFLMRADPDEMPKVYEQFHRARRDRLSDCEACEMNFDMEIALALGNTEQALKIAAPILDGQKRCAEIPHKTYSTLAEHFLYKGDLHEAQYYAILAERWTELKPEFLYDTGLLLEVAASTDPQHGWKILKRSLPDFVASRNPESRLVYARGAYRLLRRINQLRGDDPEGEYTLNAIFRQLPVTCTKQGISIPELEQWFYTFAKEQSELLDARNGSSFYMDKLEKELVVDTEKNADQEPQADTRPHGIIRRLPAAFMIGFTEDTLPEPAVLEERLRAWLPEDKELLSSVVEEGEYSFSVKSEDSLFELTLRQVPDLPPIPARPVAGMDPELLGAIMEHPKYMALTEYSDAPMEDLALIAQVVVTLFPGMRGFVDLMTLHAYPVNWMKYVARYSAAVTPSDMFGLELSGDEETQSVWMCTRGLSCMGIRELEINGSTMDNYTIMADLLDEAAAVVTSRGVLPESGEVFGRCRAGEKQFVLTWKPSPHDGETSIGELMLLESEDAEPVSPADCEELLEAGEADFPQTNAEFYRRRALAQQSYPLLLQLMDRNPEQAAVRMEIRLDDEIADQVGYRYETLWIDELRRDGDDLIGKATETPDALPDIKEGDELRVSCSEIVSWYIKPVETEYSLTENTGFAAPEVDET